MFLSSINDQAFDAHMKSAWTLMWLAALAFIPIAAMGLHAVWFWLNWVFVPEPDLNRRRCPTCGSPMPAPSGAASSVAHTSLAPTPEAHS